MKTINLTYLPDKVEYKGIVYDRDPEPQNADPDKSIKVSVLSTHLRFKNDLHGKPYKPQVYIFTNFN